MSKLLPITLQSSTRPVRLGKSKAHPAGDAQRSGSGSVDASDKETGEARRKKIYNTEELNRLIQNAEPGFYNSLIFTVAMTGMRHGEAWVLHCTTEQPSYEGAVIQRSVELK